MYYMIYKIITKNIKHNTPLQNHTHHVYTS